MDSDMSWVESDRAGDLARPGGGLPGPPNPPTSVDPPRPKGWALPAWLVICAMCLLVVVLPYLEESSPDSENEDPVGLTLMQMQSKYVVGVTRVFPMDTVALYEQTKVLLNTGTVGQRQRFVVLAAELGGPGEARQQLDELDALIADPPVGEPPQLTPEQAAVQRILHQLYSDDAPDPEKVDAAQESARAASALDADDREMLVEQLGWFGRLALAPVGGDDVAARDAVLRPANIVAKLLVLAAVLGIVAAFVGFVVLILLIVFALVGTLQSGLGGSRTHHAIYAETFAVWMVVFVWLQFLAELLSTTSIAMLVTIIMVFGSLVALGWPVVRGIPWRTVRQDVGLTAGRMPVAEPCIGVGAYLATLPLLAGGLLLTLGLMAVQGFLAGELPTFAPTGGPAHPVIVYMSGPDLWPKLQVLILAVVAAPIVEETMFRGVLYRHLRDATGDLGLWFSVLVSTSINGFVFAAIHPQGYVAIPALMGLAYGMALVREWRDTLIPSMIVHAVSNGLVMGFLMIALGA